MFRSVSFSGCFNRRPWTLRQLDHVVVCSKKKPPNNGYPGRGRRPRKKYSKNVEDEVDISPLYDDRAVTEIPRGFVVDCNVRINECVEEGNLKEAQQIFDLMVKRGLDPDVVTYTTLMKGYSRAQDGKRVFELFRDMEKHGVRPEDKTFNTVIRACAYSGDLHRALFLFDRMKNRFWMKPDVVTYSSVLKVCASAKDLETAKEIYEEMISSETKCDAITLATMLDVYAECCNKDNARRYLKESRDLMEGMELEGVKANLQGFSTLLKLCARGSLTMEAMELLEEMTTKNMRPNVLSYSTVIDGVSKDEKLSDEEVLELSKGIVGRMKQEEIPLNAHISSNLINVALRVEDLHSAVGLFNEMKNEGLKPDATTFGIMIKCYAELGDPSDRDAYLEPCLNLLAECEQYRIKMDGLGYVSLLSACANVANLDAALKVWKKMEERGVANDVFLYTAMINVYISSEDVNGAISLFSKMKTIGPKPSMITYSTMMKCYEKLGDTSTGDAYLKPCLDLLAECEREGINMDGPGFVSLLSACANVANLDKASRVWSKMIEAKQKPDVFVYSAMISVCLSADAVDRAFALLDEMKTSGVEPNEVTYTTFIAHFMRKKDRSGAQRIYNIMKSSSVQPDKESLRMLRALHIG